MQNRAAAKAAAMFSVAMGLALGLLLSSCAPFSVPSASTTAPSETDAAVSSASETTAASVTAGTTASLSRRQSGTVTQDWTLPQAITLRPAPALQGETTQPPENYEFGGYAYATLSMTQRFVYTQMEQTVRQMKSGMVSAGLCTEKDLYVSYLAMKNDHPEYFWHQNGFRYRQIENVWEFAFALENTDFQYTYSTSEKSFMEQKLNLAVEEAMQVIRSGMSEYQKELALHNYLVDRVTYDHAAASDPSSEEHASAFTAYGALVEGAAVCEGYARAYSLLLNRAGLENTLASGYLTTDQVGHIWNMVQIGGEWYHVDPTLNDTSDGDFHLYFNVSDTFIKTDHRIDPSFSAATEETLRTMVFNMPLPAASSMTYNWAVNFGTYIESQGDMIEVVSAAIERELPMQVEAIEFVFGESYARTYSGLILQEVAPVVYGYYDKHPEQHRRQISISGIQGGKGFKVCFS